VNKLVFKVLRRKVWVKQRTNLSQPTMAWNACMELTEEQANEIDRWVKETGTGKRVSYDRWLLDSKESLMLFRLRWIG
jgi:hypothetical protein